MGNRYDHDDERPSAAGKIAKGALLVLGGLAVLNIAAFLLLGPVLLFFSILSKAVFLGMLAGAGYVGYKLVAGGGEERKAVSGGRQARALGPGRSRGGNSSDDFERKMRELEAIERRLDAEISKR